MAFSDFDIMSRCKKILEHLADVTDVAINNVKSVIDTVNTNVNSVKSYTSTNNTASETGILSQKLSWLITVNKNHGSLERTSAGSQNWTCPTGVYYVYVIACGGQGGGGGGGGGYYGGWLGNDYYFRKAGGGGSGAVSEIVSALIPVTPGTVYALTVGAGGSAGAAGTRGTSNVTDGGAGGTGGDTKFGSIFTVLGGGGGGGGKYATYSSKSISAAPAADAGSTRVNSSSTFRQISLNIIAAAAGKAGVAPPANNGNRVNTNFGSNGGEGTAGGDKVTNRLGLSSGAGGAGGRNGYAGTSPDASSNGTNGSAGGAGSAGYIKVIW